MAITLENLPDQRSISVASRHGIDISSQKVPQLTADDFARFDLIIGMDRENIDNCAAGSSLREGRVNLFLELALGVPVQIPDP